MAMLEVFLENKKGDIIRYLLLRDKGNAILPDEQPCTFSFFCVVVE